MTFYALISHSWDSVMKDISSNDQKAAHSVPSARQTCAFSWEEGKRWQSRNYGMMPPVKRSEGHHGKQSTWGTEIRAMASGALLLQISPSPKVWRLLLQFPANRLFLRGVIKYSFWVKDIAKATECNSKSTQKKHKLILWDNNETEKRSQNKAIFFYLWKMFCLFDGFFNFSIWHNR